MKRLTLTILSAALLTIPAFGQGVRKYEINVKEFDQLKVIEGVNVDYRQSADSAGMVSFTTTPELAGVLMFDNNGSQLTIQIATDGIDYSNLPTVTVYSRFLLKVENSGDSLVRVFSPAPTPQFKARVIGNGQLSLRGIDVSQLDISLDTGKGIISADGRAAQAKYTLIGTGSIQAEDLAAKKVKCSLLGTGFIGCNAEEELNIVGATSGRIFYKGEPTIKNRSLGIKLIPLDDDGVEK